MRASLFRLVKHLMKQRTIYASALPCSKSTARLVLCAWFLLLGCADGCRDLCHRLRAEYALFFGNRVTGTGRELLNKACRVDDTQVFY
jgi:hypothetical protein